MSLAARWRVRTLRRRHAAAARQVVARAEAQVSREAELLAYADWLQERWPEARFVLTRPSRARALVEIAYAGDAQGLTWTGVEVNHLYRLTRCLLAVGESRVVHPLEVVDSDSAGGPTVRR